MNQDDQLDRLRFETATLNAEAAKLNAEAAKLAAEERKLFHEQMKLNAEAPKFQREHLWYPIAVAAGLLGTGAVVGGLAVKLLHG